MTLLFSLLLPWFRPLFSLTQSPRQNENAGPLVPVLRISRLGQQSIKPSRNLSKYEALRACTGPTSVKPALPLPGLWQLPPTWSPRPSSLARLQALLHAAATVTFLDCISV